MDSILHLGDPALTVENNSHNMMVRINNRQDNARPASNLREGRVEVSFDYGRTWGTICSTNWSLREANVVCQQLGVGYADVAAQHQNYGSKRTNPWAMVGTLCRGNEKHLKQCRRERQYPDICNESNNNIAVVKCVDKLPDLELVLKEIEVSAHLDMQPLDKLRCSLEENCLASDARQLILTHPNATRKLLRFSTKTNNIGTAAFRPYDHSEVWGWHQCHNHYHSMETYATFDVFDLQHRTVTESRKSSFCLMDTGCKPGVPKTFACRNNSQGISPGCYDTYASKLDCQWVDVTNLQPHRQYILRMAVNPEYLLGELSFENNAAECQIFYTGEKQGTKVTNCVRTSLWQGV